ncbi:MAG: CotH kinase family protein [Pseudomonadota bacterium]|nr:CotH kinase family protein [Pseudomonadota bacterium]
MILVLSACIGVTVERPTRDQPPDTDPARETGDTSEGGVETLPGLSDTGLSDTALPDRPPSPPAVATLSCAEAIPTDGKTPCAFRLVDAHGVLVWEGTAGVGLHGRSSAGFPKPQLALELRDEAGADAPANLLGTGEEADWLLNGMYVDRALLRNKLAYDLYRDLTDDHDWAPESEYVEVTYQGEYIGLFTLVERIDRADDRTPVPADDGTGAAFIVKASEAGIPSSLQYGLWEVVYPSAAAQTPEVIAGVTARLARMESLLAARDPALWDQIDLDSAVAFVLIEEAFKNNDAFYLSHHVYVHDDGKLHFAPWDLDLSLGQPSYNDNENPTTWLAYRPEIVLGMGRIPGFPARMASMWAEWRAGGLADDAFDARLTGVVRALGDAPARNFERWPIGDIQFSGYLYAVSSYDEEIARVLAFAHARFAWMDESVGTWSGA